MKIRTTQKKIKTDKKIFPIKPRQWPSVRTKILFKISKALSGRFKRNVKCLFGKADEHIKTKGIKKREQWLSFFS